MAVEVVIPLLGSITIERGKIVRWTKKEGEPVQKGEPIFEVETDKVVTEVESPGTGILSKILVQENTEVPVLSVVAVITGKGEELPEKYRAMKPEWTPSPPPRAEAPPKPRSPVSPEKPPKAMSDVAILGAGTQN